MGLRVEDREELYVFRMRMTISEQLSVASFDGPDLRRLEQLVIDALGIGTLYNTNPVLSAATMLNDSTYRNHMAPRLNQLALLFFESTHAWLTQHGIADDDRNVWKLPMQDLAEIDAHPPRAVDQGCSPIPTPRISSPEACDFFSRFQAERGFTDEEMADWLRTRKARASTSSCVDGHLETNEPPFPLAESLQPGALDQRSDSSLDIFADLCSDEAEHEMHVGHDSFDLSDVPTTSNGPDCLSAATTSTTSHRVERQFDDSHKPAGESVQSGVPRQLSSGPMDSSLRSQDSATKTSSVKEAAGSVPPSVVGQLTLRIPSYGGRCTQYVDLSRTPLELSQDAPSEASHDEPSHELSDTPSETSDEEPTRGILDDSSESSLDEPSPTDSGFFDFDNVPVADPEPVNANDSVQENTPKDSAEDAIEAMPLNVDEEEADSDTDDKCAHKNCRRPQYNNINWVQCDDCDEWYHNLCILGEEVPFEEVEFHCECASNSKRKPRAALKEEVDHLETHSTMPEAGPLGRFPSTFLLRTHSSYRLRGLHVFSLKARPC